MANINHLINNSATMQLDQAKEKNLAKNNKAKEASMGFASYVASHLLKQVSPSKNDVMFNSGEAEKIFKDLLMDEYAKEVVKQNDFGISKRIEAALINVQETNSGE